MVPLDLEKLPSLVAHLQHVWSNKRLHPTKRRDALIVAALLNGLRSQEVINLRPSNAKGSVQRWQSRGTFPDAESHVATLAHE